jgi:hypothetical protein
LGKPSLRQGKVVAAMKTHQLLLFAGAVVMARSAFAADEQSIDGFVDIRRSWEVGVQMSDYRYTEPVLGVEIWGPRVGLTAAYTQTNTNNWFVKIDGRVSYGSLKYEGSGTQNTVPDFVFEARGYFGKDYFPRHGVSLSPYAGLGYRYLYNDLRGTTSTGEAGYRRYSQYFYVPLGLSSRFNVSGKWSVAPTIEYDYFIAGRQESRLTDVGSGYDDAYNEQSKGYGYRLSVMLEKEAWAFGPWLHFWSIEDSDIVTIGTGVSGLEPQNETREFGVELKYRF